MSTAVDGLGNGATGTTTTPPRKPEEPQMSQVLKPLKWAEPATAVQPSVSLDTLLQGLQLLATDEARDKAKDETGWTAETLSSMQVIKSGTLAITKFWSKTVAAAGGGAAALLTIVGGYLKIFRENVGDPIAVSLFAGAALVLAAASIALAVIIKGDLDARGIATAARTEARAAVTAEFLRTTAILKKVVDEKALGGALVDGKALLLASNAGHRLWVIVPSHHQGRQEVMELRHTGSSGIELKVKDCEEWVKLQDVSEIFTSDH